MKKNIGEVDKAARTIIAVVIAILIYAEILSGTLAYILLALAAVLLITSFINFCPIYRFFGISSRKKIKEK